MDEILRQKLVHDEVYVSFKKLYDISQKRVTDICIGIMVAESYLQLTNKLLGVNVKRINPKKMAYDLLNYKKEYEAIPIEKLLKN